MFYTRFLLPSITLFRSKLRRVGSTTPFAACASCSTGRVAYIATGTVAAATYAAYGDPDYNVAFAARPAGDSATFHAYAVFSPHLKEDCSLATLQYGLPICHTAPEDAAFALRRALAALG